MNFLHRLILPEIGQGFSFKRTHILTVRKRKNCVKKKKQENFYLFTMLIKSIFLNTDYMERNNSKVTFGGNPVTLLGHEVKTGEKAASFTLLDSGLKPRTLADYQGKIKIVAVYPSIDTGVCATQNRKFNEIAFSLSDDVVVLSVSCDLPFAQSRFCAAEGLKNVITLSDHKDTGFGLAYGFLIEELRLLARGTVVIDKEDIIRFVEYVPEIVSEPDYDAALDAVRKLI